MIERFVRNEEVVGLIPIRSTNSLLVPPEGLLRVAPSAEKALFAGAFFCPVRQLIGSEWTCRAWPGYEEFTALSLEVWPLFCYLGGSIRG